MKHDVKAPSVGESITEVSILKWVKKSGQQVKVGDTLLEIESDKATVEIVAESAGALTVLKPEGERIPVGEVIGVIDDSIQGSAEAPAGPGTLGASMPAPAAPRTPAMGTGAAAPGAATTGAMVTGGSQAPLGGPAARKAAAEQGVDVSQIAGTGKDGRVTKGDISQYAAQKQSAFQQPVQPSISSSVPRREAPPAEVTRGPVREGERRVPLSNIRVRIAERLVQAQHTAAILTTFNEVDMGPVMEIRTKHKEAFQAKHGVPLSFMSFFTRGSVEALKLVPEVNAFIEGRDIVYHDYSDIGIAVGTERGLVVPVLRDAGRMGFVEIEKKMAELATKARAGKLSIADMSGGTFTISNGGVYGSLLSTPILNPPQSGILGMHKIQERPMAIQGRVEVRPMMYLALSYDHRLIDGKGAVTFLVKLKEFLEHPETLGFEY